MPWPGYYRKRREKLVREDPHCFWCHRELKLYPSWPSPEQKTIPEDYPTIDHLTSRFMGPRKHMPNMRVLVLACPACNNARNVAQTDRHIWRTRWKSGSFPFPLRWLGTVAKRYHQARKTRRKRAARA